MHVAVSVLISYLLSNAIPVKDEAKKLLKDKLDGWQETVALALFDIAWQTAMGAVGNKIGSLTKEQANIVAEAHVAAARDWVA